MDVVILTKRGISFQQLKRGEQTVIYIPSAENIKVYKDITNTDTIAERYGASELPPLWRQHDGQSIVYGLLPETLAQRRQALKVYLAPDLAPPTATTFYYVFGAKWVVHGVRETDDEGRRGWRVTLLKVPERKGHTDTESVVEMVVTSISEHMLEEGEVNPCVAIYENLALYEDFQNALKPLGVQPVPFSTLKVSPKVKPLHKQRDFSLLMGLSIFVGLLLLAGAVSFWLVNWLQVGRLVGQIEDIKHRIVSVQVNANIGHIHEPEAILQSMQKTFNQKPSAIVDAAARFGAEFGKLESITFAAADDAGPANSNAIHTEIPKGQRLVRITTSSATNQLLLDQEKLANLLLPKSPWVRRVENLPMGRGSLTLDVLLQVEKPEGTP